MKVDRLRPSAQLKTQFARSHHVTVPDQPGCYALVTYGGEVLYVGLATDSIHDRMGAHLDTPEKTKAGTHGAPYWFHYILCTALEVHAIERGWMNQAILEDGDTPALNKIYSPL